MSNNPIDTMAMLNAIENFVSEFERVNLYSNFGNEMGQMLLDEFGASMYKLGPATQPLDCFYHFIAKVKFMKGDVYQKVNEVFYHYYQGALNF